MTINEELNSLHALLERGALTPEEFAQAKARLLGDQETPDVPRQAPSEQSPPPQAGPVDVPPVSTHESNTETERTAGTMSTPEYKVGDIANGYIRTEDGWLPAPPPQQKKSRTGLAVLGGVLVLAGLISIGAAVTASDDTYSGDEVAAAEKPVVEDPAPAVEVAPEPTAARVEAAHPSTPEDEFIESMDHQYPQWRSETNGSEAQLIGLGDSICQMLDLDVEEGIAMAYDPPDADEEFVTALIVSSADALCPRHMAELRRITAPDERQEEAATPTLEPDMGASTAPEPDFANDLYPASWDDGVTVHTEPRRASESVQWLPFGTMVHIVCRTRGESAVTRTGTTTTWWDWIDSPVSGYLSDARVNTGGIPPKVPLC